MVIRRDRPSRGGSTAGCMFSLLIFVAAIYYGINIGRPWFRYYQLVDEMRVSARLATSLTDPVIKLRREAIDFLTIRGMKPGEYRFLSGDEIQKLYKAGEKPRMGTRS